MYQTTNTRIIVPEFDVRQPTSLEAVLRELEHNAKGTRLLAGGTDLLVQIKLERTQPARLIDITRVPELMGMAVKDGMLIVGAATSIRTLANGVGVRERYTALAESCDAFSTVPVMIMGTIGGNLCNASPAADTAPALFAFDGAVELASCEGSRRTVPLDEFFVGPGRTVMREDEVMVAVRLPKTAAGTGSAFVKIGRVAADISKVSAAVKLVRKDDRVSECRIAVGAVAATPMRAYTAEQYLAGRRIDAKTLADAARAVEEDVKPITDVRSTKEYRTHVAGVAVKDALGAAWQRARGGERQ
ncbi:MAG: xanthine dehydrogenase family protein subunit M [Burkholderiales bacterium]|nr:xanthine dehydrogenase family protein subunit M [Burkholderiales bacterium]